MSDPVGQTEHLDQPASGEIKGPLDNRVLQVKLVLWVHKDQRGRKVLRAHPVSRELKVCKATLDQEETLDWLDHQDPLGT